MKHVAAIVGMSFLVCVPGLKPAFAKDAPTSAPQLLQELNAGLKAKDKDAILALFNWEGVGTATESFYSGAISNLLEEDVNNLKLAPLPKGFRAAYRGHDGFRLSANVSVVGVVDVRLKSGEILPYGRKGNAFYLAGLSREKIAATKSPSASDQRRTIQVQDTNGKPLPHATIICADADTVPELVKTVLRGGLASFQTDQSGRFTLPLTNSDLFVVAANDHGFGWLPNRDLTNQAALVMESWGRIEGVRENRNHFVLDEHLMLEPDRDYYRGYVLWPIRGPIGKTTTDAQGHFVFEHVPPLKCYIDRQETQRAYWGHFWSVEAKSGETTKLDISTRGRTVFGRVVAAPGLDSSTDLAACSGSLLSDHKDWAGSLRSVDFPVSADGFFHADRVEPGNYEITGEVWRENTLVAFFDPIRLRVPDDNSDAADVPFDMGTVTLKAALNPGDAAPDFSSRTLDGKPLKLSDFRGKYVLLDFWATWCAPCIAETPNMKTTYEAFGKDKRFVMISLSLDPEPAAPRKFVSSQGIAWTQDFLGDMSKDKVTRSYGVFSIPAIFLIGPDGKVLTANLRGSKIKEAVAAALAR